MTSDNCTHCDNTIPQMAERCPHCGLPGLFPNVRAAEGPVERGALNARYKKALERAHSRGHAAVARDFELAVTDSRAVIARPLEEVQRLANSDNEIYATFYKLSASGIRLPSGGKWDVRREVADAALFPGYKEQIRFAALSLDGVGLTNSYGECSLVLRDHMVAHRASAFEENSIIFMKRHGITMWEAHRLPPGYRATWKERAKLSLAKLVDELAADTKPDNYARILLREGRRPADDTFIEVHIWGPITRRTFERVLVTRRRLKRAGTRVIVRALQEKLEEVGVKLEEV